MKVYIGPYRYDFIPVTRWEQSYERWRTKKLFIEDVPDEWYDKLVFKFFDKLRAFVAPINSWSNTRPRKIEVEYHDYDTWNLDQTLALIILPGLKQLRATNHGYGYVDPEDAPEKVSEEERYLWILDQMIWAFEQILDPSDFTKGTWDMRQISVNKDGNPDPGGKYFQLVEGSNHTFDIDKNAETAYNERISNGLRLFGKYYRSLWD